jgi:hypothetical protein
MRETRKNKTLNHFKKISKKNKTRKKTRRKTQNKTYSNKDFSSGDGMLTTVWGPSMWHYLHTLSFNYPVHPTAQDKKYYRNFILNLQKTLPCKYCRINLKNNLKIHPLNACDMANRRTFSYYVYRLHEVVNKMLGKRSNLCYKDVRERYEHFRSRCTESMQKKKVFNFKKTLKQKKSGKDIEKGCTEPLYGKKSKCIIKIVPQEKKCPTFQMDNQCIKKRE